MTNLGANTFDIHTDFNPYGQLVAEGGYLATFFVYLDVRNQQMFTVSIARR